MLFDWNAMPLWATVTKRVLTLLFMSGLGLHAFVQHTRYGAKMLAAERHVFFWFSVLFLFGAVANFVAAVLAVMIHKKQGPFEFGVFSFLMTLLYAIFFYRAKMKVMM